jgi:hypothetical protein
MEEVQVVVSSPINVADEFWHNRLGISTLLQCRAQYD